MGRVSLKKVFSGIYCYKDKENNDKIIYIGKDSHIDKNKRFKDHMQPSNYNAQKINQVLQNNPNRYEYVILKKWKTKKYNPKLSNAMEIIYIHKYNPLFNFTKGGEGTLGFKHSEETIKKFRESRKGFKHTDEAKRKIGLASKERVVSLETKEKIRQATLKFMANPKNREHISQCMSGKNNHMWKDYPRIIKDGHKHGKQNYALKYNGKRVFSSVYYDKVEKQFLKLKEEIKKENGGILEYNG